MNTIPDYSSVQDKRHIRIFISSTFSDMQEERDELVKFVFPEIRKRCKQRGLEFTEVDLRWGVTEEQKAEGKVLPICMAEIERCRPYFIGLLGERYGWISDSIDTHFLNSHPWIKKHQDKSVTELEILHGVINNEEMRNLAYFYFRNYEKSIAVESVLANSTDYRPDPASSAQKLKDLKEKISKSGYPLRLDYPDAKSLGQFILDDLWNAIDKRFPLSDIPSDLEKERMAHEAFAAQRIQTYIGREEYYDVLNRHVEGIGPPLVVTGESGIGKSALIANWISRYKRKHPDQLIVTHYIGCDQTSTDYLGLILRIIREIKSWYSPEVNNENPDELDVKHNFDEEIPSDRNSIISALPKWLSIAAEQGRMVLVLDALNQLEVKDNAHDLKWLPEYIPSNIRLVLSTLPGNTLEALESRKLPMLEVQKLNPIERKTLLTDYLQRYSRTLGDKQIKLIIDTELSTNPLFLKTLLQELRFHGDHSSLIFRIKYYLESDSTVDLYKRILARYEQDYEQVRPYLVKDAMSLLWTSRRGLSETELLYMLGWDSDQLPKAYWSPLFLACDDSLISKSGLLNFAHEYLKQAVFEKYLSGEETSSSYQVMLADYFESSKDSGRKAEELPYHLKMTGLWQRLLNCLTNWEVFELLNNDYSRFELLDYWEAATARLDMENNADKVFEIMRQGYSSPDDQLEIANNLGGFFMRTAAYRSAETLMLKAIEISSDAEAMGGKRIPGLYYDLANLYWILREYTKSEEICRQSLELVDDRQSHVPQFYSLSLALLGKLLELKKDFDGAEHHYRLAIEHVGKAYGDQHHYKASPMSDLSMLLYNKGELGKAEEMLNSSLSIYKKSLGEAHPYTAIVEQNMGMFHFFKSDYERALEIFLSTLKKFEFIYGPEIKDLQASVVLNNLGRVYAELGNLEESKYYYERLYKTYHAILGPDHPDTKEIQNALETM